MSADRIPPGDLFPERGQLEILGGGAIAVDTDTLRQTAARFEQTALDLEVVQGRVAGLQHRIASEVGFHAQGVGSAWALCHRIIEVVGGARQVAAALRNAAGVYEHVELSAQRSAAVAAGDTAAIARIDARIAFLNQEYPWSLGEARALEWDRAVMWSANLQRQSTELGASLGSEIDEHRWLAAGGVAFGGVAIAYAMATGFSRQGLIARDEKLRGVGTAPATLVPVAATPTKTAAPTSLSSVAARLPGTADSRVRVEKYTMPDGSKTYALYVAGTETMLAGGDEAWDTASNLELYRGDSSASYEATLAALEAAGAEPGDTVQAFGYSQGAMITSHLAVEGGYDVQTLVTIGSPVEADVGDGTLAVSIRHTDDPVAALAGGGHMAGVGAPGSIVVERESNPVAEFEDLSMRAHFRESYVETLEMVDASTDPRLDALRSVFDQLGTAEAVEVYEYGVIRGATGAAGGVSSGGGAVAG